MAEPVPLADRRAEDVPLDRPVRVRGDLHLLRVDARRHRHRVRVVLELDVVLVKLARSQDPEVLVNGFDQKLARAQVVLEVVHWVDFDVVGSDPEEQSGIGCVIARARGKTQVSAEIKA